MNHHRRLIITGMHRCGTSFVANWLQASGLYIGDELAGATPSNVRGHFEDIEVLEFHERMLKANDTSMYMYEEQQLVVTAADEAEALEIVRKRDEVHSEWGWKQPRATLFLDLWRRVLPDLHFVIPLRHPVSVINSIVRREANKCLLRNDAINGPRLHAAYLGNLSDHVARYDGMYAVHCQRIVEMIKSVDEDRFLLINFHNIRGASDAISNKLKNWGFQFDLIPYQELFEEQLLIKKGEFLVEAEDLSNQSIGLFEALIEYA